MGTPLEMRMMGIANVCYSYLRWKESQDKLTWLYENAVDVLYP